MNPLQPPDAHSAVNYTIGDWLRWIDYRLDLLTQSIHTETKTMSAAFDALIAQVTKLQTVDAGLKATVDAQSALLTKAIELLNKIPGLISAQGITDAQLQPVVDQIQAEVAKLTEENQAFIDGQTQLSDAVSANTPVVPVVPATPNTAKSNKP